MASLSAAARRIPRPTRCGTCDGDNKNEQAYNAMAFVNLFRQDSLQTLGDYFSNTNFLGKPHEDWVLDFIADKSGHLAAELVQGQEPRPSEAVAEMLSMRACGLAQKSSSWVSRLRRAVHRGRRRSSASMINFSPRPHQRSANPALWRMSSDMRGVLWWLGRTWWGCSPSALPCVRGHEGAGGHVSCSPSPLSTCTSSTMTALRRPLGHSSPRCSVRPRRAR